MKSWETRCICDSEGILINADKYDDQWFYTLAAYEQKWVGSESFWQRIKQAWRYIRHRQLPPYVYWVELDRAELLQLIDRLDDALAATA